jgi:hypothetical protein
LKGEEEAKNVWLSGCREVKFAKVFWFFFSKKNMLASATSNTHRDSV